MAGLRPYIMGLVLVVLFSFCILSFTGNFIQYKNPNSEVLSSKYGLNTSINNMNNQLSSFSTLSNKVYNDLGSAQPSATDYLFLIFQGAFYIPLSFASFAFTGLSSLTTMMFPMLAGTGLGTIVSVCLGVLFSGLIVTIVLLIIYAIRTGVSEGR